MRAWRTAFVYRFLERCMLLRSVEHFRSLMTVSADSATARSRSPAFRCGLCEQAKADNDAAHVVRKQYTAPKQSKFRVAAVLRFVRKDGTEGVIEAVNAEAHDGNIAGAICAERAALCRFQKEEQEAGARITRCVCVTDALTPIFPGPLCREFLISQCDLETEIVASGASGPTTSAKLKELLPLPSLYRGLNQDAIVELASSLQKKITRPTDGTLAKAYDAAVAAASSQEKQTTVFPIVYGAAVVFSDGSVSATCEFKGLEYGCTMDAVRALLAEIKRRASTEGENGKPAVIVQADNFGIAHAPFAAARSLLVEHGFGGVRVAAHDKAGAWSEPMTVQDLMPMCNLDCIF
eukprot:TRINITY_DN19015_c0_g1_i1.p1 TRINITY_DN19015_c0_g1~~TRINITY_DN19015_c0_g1_i1.p1  ORF type:complete len:350 (+),score=78.35 TRINITY_DN19015_c0_g1_i1:120-1169(+)